MKVKELIIRLLNAPMDAEIMLCTNYEKKEVETHGCVKVVSRGEVFDIDKIEHWSNRIYINFTERSESE